MIIRSCRDKRLRNTIFPVLSIPIACNTRVAMSIPSPLISCCIGLASCGSMGSRIVNALWLIEVDPHRGGSISLRPDIGTMIRSPHVSRRPRPLGASRHPSRGVLAQSTGVPAPSTRSFNVCAAVKRTTRRAAIAVAAPVLGLRPMRARLART